MKGADDDYTPEDARFATLVLVTAALNDLTKEIKKMRNVLEVSNDLASRDMFRRGMSPWPWKR